MIVKHFLFKFFGALILVFVLFCCGEQVDPQPKQPVKTKDLNSGSNGKNNTDGANGVGHDAPGVPQG